MKRTLAILAASMIIVSFAVAQGTPVDKSVAAGKAPKKVAPPGAMGAPPGQANVNGPAAAPSMTQTMPKPPAELDAAMKYFEGAWKCTSKVPAGSMGPGSPELVEKSTIKFKKAMGGFFYQGEYESKKSKTNPGMKGTLMISYQPGVKIFTLTSSNDMGGATFQTAPSMEGEVLAFSGEAYVMGQKIKVRETITRAAPKGASHKFEADMGSGFQSMGEDVCTR